MFQIEIQNIRKAQFEDKYGIYLQDFVCENEKIPVNEFIEKIKSIFGDVNIKIIWCDENNGNKIHLASEYEWIKNQLYDYKIVVNTEICGLTITFRDPSLSQNVMDKLIEETSSMKKGFDPVSCPSHYTEGRKYEPRKVIADWELNFNLGNAVKYISRAGRKGDKIEDLRKAIQYIEFELEELGGKRR